MYHNTKYATWSTKLLSCCFTHCHVRNCDNPLPWQSTAVVPSDNPLPWQSTAVVSSTFVLECVLICHVCSAFLFGLQTAVVSKFTNKLYSVHQFIFILLNSHTSKFTYIDFCASDLRLQNMNKLLDFFHQKIKCILYFKTENTL